MREMDCPNCKKRKKTRKGKYHYTESGLQNVWLIGVQVFKCDCGEKFAFIPCVQELHNLIAEDLLKQESQLSGREIRFLRKHMGLKAKDFAERLGVKNVTVSRWERGEIIPHETIDRLIRYFYAANMKLIEIAAEIAKSKFRKVKKGEKESPILLPIEKIRRESCVVNA